MKAKAEAVSAKLAAAVEAEAGGKTKSSGLCCCAKKAFAVTIPQQRQALAKLNAELAACQQSCLHAMETSHEAELQARHQRWAELEQSFKAPAEVQPTGLNLSHAIVAKQAEQRAKMALEKSSEQAACRLGHALWAVLPCGALAPDHGDTRQVCSFFIFLLCTCTTDSYLQNECAHV